MSLVRMFNHRRVAFAQCDDADQSVLSSIRFDLVAYKLTIRASDTRRTTDLD